RPRVFVHRGEALGGRGRLLRQARRRTPRLPARPREARQPLLHQAAVSGGGGGLQRAPQGRVGFGAARRRRLAPLPRAPSCRTGVHARARSLDARETRTSKDEQESAQTELEEQARDLATQIQTEAQKSNDARRYADAVHAYERYLASFDAPKWRRTMEENLA